MLSIGSPVISSESSGGAGTDYVSYVVRVGLSGSVSDSETGELVDDVVIEGEIHSETIYFRVEVDGDVYSYWLWSDSQHTELLRRESDVPLDHGVFTLPLDNLIDKGKHEFDFTVNAHGYQPKALSGEFYLTQQNFVQIELDPSDSESEPGSFSLTLNPNSVEVTRNWEVGPGYIELSISAYEASGRDDGEPIWSVDSRWISEDEYNSNSSHYQAIDERTTNNKITGYKVPVYKRSVTWVDDYSQPIYDTYWVDGYWTYKTVKDYGWKKTSFWTWFWRLWWGGKTKVKTDYNNVISYTIHYNEFHRDWHWLPPGWGDWYFHKSGSFTVSPSKGSNYWKGKKWGGAWYQDWYKYCTDKKTNYGYNYYVWGVTGTHQEKDEWIPGHEETDYDTIVGYKQKPIYGDWTLDHWKTVTKSKGESYNGTVSHNSTTQWRYSEKQAIRSQVTEYKVKELKGYRVESSSEVWSSEPASTTISLNSSGYIGEVQLSVDDSNLPDGTMITLSSDSINLATTATATLEIDFLTSEDTLAGTYSIEVTANPEVGESESETFVLEVESEECPEYRYAPILTFDGNDRGDGTNSITSEGEAWYPVNWFFDDKDIWNNHANYVRHDMTGRQIPFVITHKTRDKFDGKSYLVVEYWYYYVFNEHWPGVVFNHDHDWEAIFVALNSSTGNPELVTRSYHGEYFHTSWSSPYLEKNDTHPKLGVGNGTHAFSWGLEDGRELSWSEFDVKLEGEYPQEPDWFGDGVGNAPWLRREWNDPLH